MNKVRSKNKYKCMLAINREEIQRDLLKANVSVLLVS